jgi:hypothetical protein
MLRLLLSKILRLKVRLPLLLLLPAILSTLLFACLQDSGPSQASDPKPDPEKRKYVFDIPLDEFDSLGNLLTRTIESPETFPVQAMSAIPGVNHYEYQVIDDSKNQNQICTVTVALNWGPGQNEFQPYPWDMRVTEKFRCHPVLQEGDEQESIYTIKYDENGFALSDALLNNSQGIIKSFRSFFFPQPIAWDLPIWAGLYRGSHFHVQAGEIFSHATSSEKESVLFGSEVGVLYRSRVTSVMNGVYSETLTYLGRNGSMNSFEDLRGYIRSTQLYQDTFLD